MLIRDVELARQERAARRTPRQVLLGGETFTLLPVVPLGESFDLMDAPEPKEDEPSAVRAIVKFIRQVLVDDDVDRFDQLLRRRDDPIDAFAIIDMGTRISEVYSGLPFEPPASSSGGRASTGPRSRKRGPKAT